MTRYIVLGTNVGGDLKKAPLGLADWFGLKYGALTFHYGIGVTLFKSRRSAERAIQRTKNLNRKSVLTNYTMVEFEVIHAHM